MEKRSLEIIQNVLSSQKPSLIGLDPKLNEVKEKYVVYHKQIERRLDGSSGGAYGALVETAVKEEYYYTGTAFDENFRLHHVVSNDPEQIASLMGYKPVCSDCIGAFRQIQSLLSDREKVLFCGTPLQCYALLHFVDDTDNLVTVDLVNTDFVVQELLDKYVEELSNIYGDSIADIRFYNKEFPEEGAKRITLTGGRTVYTRRADVFEQLVQTGRFTEHSDELKSFHTLGHRVADITIGSYKMGASEDDGLGFAYISVNTEKGAELFAKARKRLTIVKEGNMVESDAIRYQRSKHSKTIDLKELKNKSLEEIMGTPAKGRLLKLKSRFAPFVHGYRFAQHNLRAYWQFIRLNFLTKAVSVDYDNNGFIYIAPHCALKLSEGFQIELHGPLNIGPRRIISSKQETRLRMEKGAKIVVHTHCAFGAGSNVEIYNNALLEVGDLRSNAELNIICGEHITLGTPVNIARNATVRDTSGHLIATPGYRMTKPITIGNHVWVCTESTVMPGVSIGDGAIVGACSFVTKKVKPFTMVQGNPAVEVGPIKYFRI